MQNNLNSDKFSLLSNKIKNDYKNINGIVIIENNNIIFEEYYNGFLYTTPSHVASITKSFISALIGIAIDKRYIKSVNQKITDFFPNYKLESNITIKNLLTMTAPYPFENFQESFEELCSQDDWIYYTLKNIIKSKYTGEFKYSSSGAHLLSAIITSATGINASEFANKYLFKHIGINEIPDYQMESFGFDELFGSKLKGWPKDPNGNSTGGWGLNLTPRDLTKLGALYLNNGKINDKQILSEKWIEKSIENNTNNYGYLWWLKNENNVFSFSAIGDGGNILCCIPSKNTIVAISSTINFEPCDIGILIKDYIF